MSNDLGRKPVALVADFQCLHRHRLRPDQYTSNLRPVNVTAVHRDISILRDRFDAGWSPEQTAGRMRLEHHPVRVSHETIYRYAHSKDGHVEKFYRHLPEHRMPLRLRGTRKHHRRKFFEELAIARRPDVIADRNQFGHWEWDLVMFRNEFGKANVARWSNVSVGLLSSSRTQIGSQSQ